MSDVVHGQPPPRGGSATAAVLVLVLGVATILGAAGAGVYFLSEWAAERQGPGGSGAVAAPGAEPVAGQAPPLISGAGFGQLLEALEEKTGSTAVVDLTLYPRYAVAVVPVPGGKGRTQSLYYDGTIREQTLGTSEEATIDLGQVDPELLVTLSRKARKVVEDPTQWYLILRAPDIEDAVIYAYASNEYGEGGYISARLDGRIVRRVTW